jgi:hypothetical protein
MSCTKITELYGLPTVSDPPGGWATVAAGQMCPYLVRKCLKNRKSAPDQTIGTCTVSYGRPAADVIICPHRLLDRRQVFTDCLHLLALHEPGNELHVVPELNVPGGSVDYCVASVRGGRVRDFVGIELQTLDTTGTVWPERQRFLRTHGVKVRRADVDSSKSYGMNWKMTAKTILVQLHHKVGTFQHVGKRLVLVIQSPLLRYMQRQFDFSHLSGPVLGNPMHFHAYDLQPNAGGNTLQLVERLSTDRDGIAKCLGLQGESNLELDELLSQIEAKVTSGTLWTMNSTAPLPSAAKDVSE